MKDDERLVEIGRSLTCGHTPLILTIRHFHLLQKSKRIASTAVDEIGEFYFTDVPDDDLSLQIDLPNLTVIGAL